MQIETIDVFHVALPLVEPPASATGLSDVLQTVLVRIQSEGLAGWGEASPGNAPRLSEEWAAGAFQCIRDWLAPALANSAVDTAGDLQQRLAVFQGNRYAKAALDGAWWDLEARRQGKPLYQLIGGSQTAIEVGPTFDQMETIDELLEALHKAVKAGFPRIGLKFRPGWDVQMLNLVRHEFPTEAIHIDCEAGLRLEHMEMLCRLDDFHLAMIEQPLPADDLVGHAMIQETIRTPLCLDEGVTTVEQADMAMELHSCQFVKIEPGRVGGLTKGMAIDETCHENCHPCWVGMVPQSTIGMRTALCLASRQNFSYPADYLDMAAMLTTDVGPVLSPSASENDGKQRIALWSEPGIGFEPDLALVERLSRAKASVSVSE
jgi:O-succinylbenzoate synthase